MSDGDDMSGHRRWIGIGVDGTIVAAAAGVRLAGLGDAGLWLDEASTAVVAQLPLGELMATVAADNQAPLWFLLVRAAMVVLGDSELAVRLPSAIAGILATAAVLWAGRHELSPPSGRAAAVLLATSPMAVHYAREARGYALLMLLAVLGWALAMRFGREPGLRRGIALAATGVAMILTHNLGALYITGLWAAGVLAAPVDRLRLRAWMLVVVATAALTAPWIAMMTTQVGELEHSFGWARQVFADESPWQPARSVAAMSHGAPAPVRSRVPEIPAGAWVGGGATALLALAGLLVRRRLIEPRAPVALAAAWTLPLVGAWTASWLLPAPVYVVGRVDAPALPLLLLAAAAGLSAVSRPVGVAVLAALVGLALSSLVTTHRVDTRSQDRAVAERIGMLRRPGEPVVAATLEAALHHYTDAGREDVLLRFPSSTRRFMNWSPVGPGDPRLHDDAREVAARATALARERGARRVWLLRTPGAAGDAVEAALARCGPIRSVVDTDYLGLRIVGFALPDPGAGSADSRRPPPEAETGRDDPRSSCYERPPRGSERTR